jgi:hypothetical protein
MTSLDQAFVASARKDGREVTHNDDTVRFEPSDLAGGVGLAAVHAVLSVSIGGEVIGYVTSFREDEHGVVSASGFREDAPRTFRTVEAALSYLRPDTPDTPEGRPGHPVQS